MSVRNVKVLKISRAKWGRGVKGGSLRWEDSKLQCCLGFACRAYGLRAKDIQGKGMPDALKSSMWKILPSWLLGDAAGALADINDAFDTTDREKESEIKRGFKCQGIKVVFTR